MVRVFTWLHCFFMLLMVVTYQHQGLAQDVSAQQSVESFLNSIRSMQFPVMDPSAHQILAAEAATRLDLEAIARKSLSGHWDQMNSGEQKQFMDLFWKLIENIAYPRTDRFLGTQEVSYQGTKAIEKGVEVSSVVMDTEADLSVPVTYYLYQVGSQWKIYDIFMDGVSLTEDLRYQFEKLLQDGTTQTLLDRMSERLSQAEKETMGS